MVDSWKTKLPLPEPEFVKKVTSKANNLDLKAQEALLLCARPDGLIEHYGSHAFKDSYFTEDVDYTTLRILVGNGWVQKKMYWDDCQYIVTPRGAYLAIAVKIRFLKLVNIELQKLSLKAAQVAPGAEFRLTDDSTESIKQLIARLEQELKDIADAHRKVEVPA